MPKFVTRSQKSPEGSTPTRIGYAAPKGNRTGLTQQPAGHVPSGGPVPKGQPRTTPKK